MSGSVERVGRPENPATSAAAKSAAQMRRAVRLLPGWLLLAFLALACAYPLVYVAFTAVKTQAGYASDPIGFPVSIHVDNLDRLKDEFIPYLQNTAFVTVISIVATLTVASLAGFALAHMRFRFRRAILLLIAFMMIQPPALLLVPLYLTLNGIGLLDNYLGLVMLYVATVGPFATYMLYSFFVTIPREMLEAAAVDGASTWRSFVSIVLPLSRSGLLALTALLFLFVWNEAVFSVMVLQGTDVRTVAVGLLLLLDSFRGGIDIPLVASGMLISVVPPLLVFVVLQRKLVRGLSAGALK